jgi:hypothetical protein
VEQSGLWGCERGSCFGWNGGGFFEWLKVQGFIFVFFFCWSKSYIGGDGTWRILKALTLNYIPYSTSYH